jgi:hypothetical protein
MMSAGDSRVVRRLQLRLSGRQAGNGTDGTTVLSELQARVRRLRSLGEEYSAVRVSREVLRLCKVAPAGCAGAT